ncbi:MAG: glycerol-3-phosphate dehydrogenase/oxidase [Planctomycetota bacterium]
MNRDAMLQRVRERREPWDLLIIGGGATGLGAAVDAASRGYDVALFEQSDFAKGTSSRSTKLVHGGVRYLQQGNVSLVIEALKERGLLRRNAPHLVHDVPFIVPSYKWWESPFYGIGLKVYDLLAGRFGFAKSSHLSKEKVIDAIPSIQPDGLLGGTQYYDGQFDDARLAIDLATTAHEHGGTLVNYAGVVGLLKHDDGTVRGVAVRDQETGEVFDVLGKAVINATGPFADGVRRLDHPDAPPIIAPSQGVHVVLDRSFLPGDAAIMVPHTDDGRVMFAIPWHDVAVVGTTDTPIDAVDLEPKPLPDEVSFILETANRYLAKTATPADLRSVFVGIRPLVKAGDGENTAALSRDHTVLIDPNSGLITIGGGKWTTYRRMAEDVIDQAATLADLPPRPCVTKDLPVHGADPDAERFGPLAFYGSDAAELERLHADHPQLAEPLHPKLPITGAQVRWACRREMARTVDDVLARRTRCLLFDAQAAIQAAPRVAERMADELNHDAAWAADQAESFRKIAAGYVYSS